MDLQAASTRTIVAHAHSEAFVNRTQSILARLGYQIFSPEEFAARSVTDELDPPRPDLRIVDERRLAEIEDEAGETPLPIILLTGRHGVTGADCRIVGAAKRPAGLHDLYRLLQLVFEITPRAAPRVATHLTTICRRHGREWKSAILSLSENGALLRSPEPVPLGTELALSFELPCSRRIELRSETAYQFLPDLGLVFSGIDPADRTAIADYVMERIIL
jgi:hypothetical protein